MHAAEGRSTSRRVGWDVREDASRDVLVALYLRDALGVMDPSGLPRMLGTGLPVEPEPADPRVAFGWLRWWIPLIEPDARGWGLPDSDDPFSAEPFTTAVRTHLDDARAWAAVAHEQYNGSAIARMQKPDTVLHELVAEREAALGRASRAWRLRIEVLPLAASGVWWIGDDAIAVDETTRDEPILYRDAIAPVVAQLV